MNGGSCDLIPEQDVVEDFARQLEQVCSISTHKNTTTRQQDEGDRDRRGYDPMSGDDDDDSLTDQVPFGYQQLAQDEDEGVSLTENDDDDSNSDEQQQRGAAHHMAVAEAPPTVSLDKSEEIPEDTANTIKSIMGSIQMPDHAIPEWAKAIPESMWLPRYQQQQQQEDDRAETDGRSNSSSEAAVSAGTITTTAADVKEQSSS